MIELNEFENIRIIDLNNNEIILPINLSLITINQLLINNSILIQCLSPSNWKKEINVFPNENNQIDKILNIEGYFGYFISYLNLNNELIIEDLFIGLPYQDQLLRLYIIDIIKKKNLIENINLNNLFDIQINIIEKINKLKLKFNIINLNPTKPLKLINKEITYF